MKTILSLALTAVFPCALVCAGGGQTEIDASDSEVQEESTSLDKSDEEALSEYRTQYLNLQKKSEEVEKKYEAIESPPRSLSRGEKIRGDRISSTFAFTCSCQGYGNSDRVHAGY